MPPITLKHVSCFGGGKVVLIVIEGRCKLVGFAQADMMRDLQIACSV